MTALHGSSWNSSTPDDRRVRANRADVAFETVMADRFYSARRKVFGWRNWWLGRTYEHLRPFANTWSALCTLASLPDRAGVRDVLPLLFDALSTYHRAGPAALTGQGPVGFHSSVVPSLRRAGGVCYGDNAWLGLALVRHQELCHDAVSLPLAERLFRFVVTGWSTDDTWAAPGGIRWSIDPAGTSRTTCTNGPAAALGALVHRLTGDLAALEHSISIYRWTRSALGRDDGLYADRIHPDGTVVADLWSHNQGAMIGAGLLLADATGDPGFLADARTTASASLGRFGLDDLCTSGPAANAIFFRNLFLLPPGASPGTISAPDPDSLDADDGTPRAAGRALARAYDDLLWEEEHDRRTIVLQGRGSRLDRMGPRVQIDALLAGAEPHA
jgi:hypothetical protein